MKSRRNSVSVSKREQYHLDMKDLMYIVFPMNIADGNGKTTEGDRHRYLEIARGSTFKCAAVKDVLGVCETISAEQNHQGKILLDRIVAMLTKMGGWSYSVKESEEVYYSGNDDIDIDTDGDTDTVKSPGK